MARIVYVLLCHRDPDAVIAQAERLVAAGDLVVLHHDAAAPRAEYARIAARLGGNPSILLLPDRRRCGWGDWSLVDATLRCLHAALAAFPGGTHFYLLSGDCLPIRPAAQIRALLEAGDLDHIECHDFFTSDWIRTGLRAERLIYRHPFNERRHRRLFYAALALQRRLGLTRRLPRGLPIRIGSQWWCLRRATVEAMLDFCAARPGVVRFFRGTWIPDETFFQTLAGHLVPSAQILCRPPTFLLFTDYGMPVTFHDDHHDLLVRQDSYFARKISPGAGDLRARLDRLFSGAADAPQPVPSDEGRVLHGFLTGQGRAGRRFAPCAWDAAGSLGAERRLLFVACKKWHVGKRLLDLLRREIGVPGLDYLFDEQAAPCPDLGGIERSLTKRNRHRRAVASLLFDALGTDRLAICVDPSRADVIADFCADRCETRVLELSCTFSDADLAGHAGRIGLAGPQMTAEAAARLFPALRQDLAAETARLRAAGGPRVHCVRQGAPEHENALSLAAFLGIPEDSARRFAAPGPLFAD